MALHQAVAEKWKKITGATLIEAYGLTEASPGVTMNPFNLRQFNGSVGLPCPRPRSRSVTIKVTIYPSAKPENYACAVPKS